MAIAPLRSDAPGCRLVHAAGTDVNVLCEGRGRRTVVLLHGFGDTHATWRNVVPALARLTGCTLRTGQGAVQRRRRERDLNGQCSVGEPFAGQRPLNCAFRFWMNAAMP